LLPYKAARALACALPVACGLAAAMPSSAQLLLDATAARFPPSTGEYSNHVAAGDLDGDGDLDLVFANGGNFASAGTPQQQRVYINNGSGTFTDESAARLGGAGFAGLCRGVAMGDIDGDGDFDLAFAQDFNRLPALFKNNGAGVFTNVTAAQLPNQTLSSSRGQFLDIENDGDLDLFFVNASGSRFGCGQFKIYVNDGAGFYTDGTATRLPVENVCEPMDVAIGDIDGDFDLDIRTAGRGNNTSRLYRNDGAGVFSTVSGIPADSTAYSYDFGDIDNDGDLDLLGANAEPGGSAENLLRNDGNAIFTKISGNLSPANAGQDDNDSKFFDFDNDGDLDLILAQIGGPEKVYLNDGSGGFTQISGVIQQINDSSLEVLVADLTGDGRLDVVTAQGESGSFVNRIYVNSAGTADSRPPRVIATEQVGKNVPGPWVVRAQILDDVTSDRNFFAQEIVLDYRVDIGRWETVPMRHSGGQVYRAVIPTIASGFVDYTVRVTDLAGNEGFGPTHSFHVGEIQLPIFSDGFETGNTSRWSSTVP
jgi:hypothetical protein